MSSRTDSAGERSQHCVGMTNTVQIPQTTSASLRLVHPLVLLAEAFSTRRSSRHDTRDEIASAGGEQHREHDTGRRDPDARAEDQPPAAGDECPPPRPGSARAAIPIPLPGEPVDTSQHQPTGPPDGHAPQQR